VTKAELRLNIAKAIYHAAFVRDPNVPANVPSPGWCWEKASEEQRMFCLRQADFALLAMMESFGVVSDPSTLSGTPVFRGTRVPVQDVLASLDKEISLDRVLAAYPSITRDQVNLVRFVHRVLF
jgi:uncharacterized protein (DUF433 family)